MNSCSVFLILSTVVSLGSKDVNSVILHENYWELRARLLKKENKISIGGNLNFETDERIANSIIMAEKYRTIDEGFEDPKKFLPAQNFMKVAKEIEKSRLFQIIRKIPKGAVLHAHELGITSAAFVYENITFCPDLYVCEADDKLKMSFFRNPPQDCEWSLLSNLRQMSNKADLINDKISHAISMDVVDPDAAYPNVDKAWDKFNSIFIHLGPLLTYKPIFESYIYQGLQELYDDNVMYIELRSTLPNLYDLDGKVYGPLDTVRTFKEISERFVKNHPEFLGMKLIYAPTRKIDQTTFDEHMSTAMKIKRKYPSFVAGFDLVGQEDKGEPLSNFADKLKTMGTSMNFFFHAGETKWNGLSTDLNLLDAVLLNATRIGHGYGALKHPTIMRIIKKRKIAIEVNPISNQVLALVKDLRNHPASVLFARNYPVVVSCDDPGLWNAKGLSYDFYEAFISIMSRNADLRALKQLAINSILFSSFNNEEKEMALKLWRDKWRHFVQLLGREQLLNENFAA